MAQGGKGRHLDDSIDEFDSWGAVRQGEEVVQRVVGTLLAGLIRSPGFR